MWKRVDLTFFCLSLFSTAAAQTLSGRIMSADSSGIYDCYILLETVTGRQVIDYTIPDEQGFYRITLPVGDTSLMKVSVQGIAYMTESKTFRLNAEAPDHTINFILREKATHLDEITILGEKLQITVKEDTIVFDVNQFRAEGDKRLIDVLKRIPGLEVNERIGQIKFKGRPIQTILLDGDNLFDTNYSIGARNISIDLIDQIEAIEDYHDNRLKKGIIRSDKVALNLKLKKNAARISGDISAGGGFKNYLADVNTIALLKKLKGFSVLHGNNSSVNESPYLKETYANEHAQEIQHYTTNPFTESTVVLDHGSPRSYINNLQYGDIKLLYKPLNKLTLTTQISAFQDRTDYQYSSLTNFRIQATTLETSNETHNGSRPGRFNFRSEVLFDISDSSTVKARVDAVRNIDDYTQMSLQNDTDLFNISLYTDKRYAAQRINYSNKFSGQNLLEFNVVHSSDETRSDFLIKKDPPVVINDVVYTHQHTRMSREDMDANASLLTTFGRTSLQSVLSHQVQQEKATIRVSENDSTYRFRNSTLAAQTRLQAKPTSNFNVAADVSVVYSDRSLVRDVHPEQMEQHNIYLNAAAKIQYKSSRRTSFVIQADREKRNPDNRFLLSPQIMIDTRNVVANVPSLNLEDRKSGALIFSYYDVYRQQNVSFSVMGSETTNSYIARQSISEDLFISTWYQTDLPRREANFSSSAGVLISPISNRLNLHSGMTITRFYNNVNESLLQKYRMYTYMLGIELNSAFKGLFNYKTSLDMYQVVADQENTPRFTNSTLSGSLETMFRVSRQVSFRLRNEVLVPSTGNRENVNYFLDAYAEYRGNQGDIFLRAQNLLDRPAITQVLNTEISTSFLSNHSFGRLILLGVNWRF